MSRRHAAIVAQQLTKAELDADEGADDDDDEDDGNFVSEPAASEPQAKKQKVGSGGRRGGTKGGLVLSDDEDAGVSSSPAAVARGAIRDKSTGVAVLNSLEQLKEDRKKKQADDLFASLNGSGAAAGAPGDAGTAATAAPLRYCCGIMAQVRAGFAMDSAAVGPLKPGEVITVLETKRLLTGTLRCRFDRGWVSEKTGAGAVILTRLALAPSLPSRSSGGLTASSKDSIAEMAKRLAAKSAAAKASESAASQQGPGGGAGAGAAAGRGVPVVKNKLKDILAGLKKSEVSTVAKSRGQWNTHTEESEDKDELKRKAANGYIEKQEFLSRVDWRQHEVEIENKKKLGWKGVG